MRVLKCCDAYFKCVYIHIPHRIKLFTTAAVDYSAQHGMSQTLGIRFQAMQQEKRGPLISSFYL